MQVAPQDRGKILADSIIGWWHDAGVDYLCREATTNWLDEPAASSTKLEEPIRRATPSPIAPVAAKSVSKDWPTDFETLQNVIASDASLPGNGYSPARAAPHGTQAPELMVLVDFPEEADLAAGKLGSGPIGQLLQAMLKACGYAPQSVHLSALAHSRPASGALPPQDIPILGEFARHQIKVAQPGRLLLLGSAVSEALLGEELMSARANLPDFNQDGGILTAVATFHPRTLLARPVLKAQAWKDLQRIVQKDQQ
ncbi:uracil-DNA glycosylase family protein [uncultured Sphingorhabdus sp.]|uniref:uracil-DNA glycosylase family protein n=1 Tax=uncultured Sphingorhabdus sp. TaxID=1686106 RepID=UPI002621B8BA|nr:uracil-DNA glycosylase family protein [uncultured Sphingorhabdus sp.]HMS18952.1 uracil-DNA glycosylase family protein [Sphingorhabdus sp.]